MHIQERNVDPAPSPISSPTGDPSHVQGVGQEDTVLWPRYTPDFSGLSTSEAKQAR